MSLFKLSTTRWHVLRLNFLFAGLFTFGSVALSYYLDQPCWLLLAAFVGVMQIVFALTGWCPSAIVLAKLGVPRD